MSDWIQLSIKVNRSDEDIVSNILFSYPIDGLNIEDENLYFDAYEKGPEWELIDLDGKKPTDYVIINVFFKEEDYGPRLRSELEGKFRDSTLSYEIIKEEKLVDMDWAKEWQKDYSIIHLGENIVIRPSWLNYYRKSGEIVIDMDPGLAFGTGSHPTTASCLELMESMDLEEKSVLDLGTGSGILGIYAGKKGASRILATDIDEQAIERARMDAEMNNVNMEIRENDMLKGIDERFDLVLANIIAEILLDSIEDFNKVLKKDGKLIFSGILSTKADKLIDGASSQGFELVKDIEKEGWRTLLFNA